MLSPYYASPVLVYNAIYMYNKAVNKKSNNTDSATIMSRKSLIMSRCLDIVRKRYFPVLLA